MIIIQETRVFYRTLVALWKLAFPCHIHIYVILCIDIRTPPKRVLIDVSHANSIRRVYTCRFQFCPKRLDKVSRARPGRSKLNTRYSVCVCVCVLWKGILIWFSLFAISRRPLDGNVNLTHSFSIHNDKWTRKPSNTTTQLYTIFISSCRAVAQP